jgi:hypothetical protein
MHHPTPEQKALFEQAERYEEQEDPYNAIKLYKRTIKLGAAWVAPYARLGQIYKYRQEWKPALYYNKKAASLQADDPACWWNIGIAATALRKTRLARTVWAKFGLDAAPREPFPISIRRVYGKQYEILWALRRGPAEAIIQNIPHPQSGRCFGDVVLIDNLIKGHHSSAQHRLPIYEELGLLKRSAFFTFSCLLQSADRKDIQVLQNLCREQGLGFEVWANATRAFSSKQFGTQPEYYAMDWATEEELLVALAAPTGSRALGALDAWKAICLKDYTAFQAYRITE